MGALILDASILIGLLDSQDAHHQAAVDAVERADLAGRTLITPASAYGEALVAFARVVRVVRVAEAREAIAGMGITVAPMTGAIAEHAASLRAEHVALRLPDAIVLATARELNGELMTYDERLAKHPARL